MSTDDNELRLPWAAGCNPTYGKCITDTDGRFIISEAGSSPWTHHMQHIAKCVNEHARLTAEVAKLRAACVAARDALHEANHELTNERCLIWCELAEKEVRAALAHKEPSDA